MTRYVKSGTVSTVQEINSELEKIATAQDEFLTRDGETPNEMKATLDMNSHRITNLPAPNSPNEPLRFIDAIGGVAFTVATEEALVFDNIAEMKLADLSVGQTIRCKRYYNGGDLVDGLLFDIVATATVDGYVNHANANGTFAINVSSGSLTFNIPTDFPNMQTAFDVLSLGSLPSRHIILNIESGHQLTKGLSITGGDASLITIISEDSTVFLSNSFVGIPLTEPDYISGEVSATYPDSLFYFQNCKAPIIGCLFDMQNNYGEGIFYINSTGFINENCGVINAGRRGINARNSTVFANNTNFSGANSSAARAQLATSLTIGFANLSNSCKTTEKSNGALYVSRGSTVEARNSNISGSGGRGIVARRSIVSAADTDLRNCVNEAIISTSSSKVDAISSLAGGSSPSVVLYQCEFNSTLSCSSVTITTPTDSTKVFRIRTGGIIDVNATTTIDAVEISRTNVFLEAGAPSFEFNMTSGYGVVYKESERPVIQTISDGIWRIRFYPDGYYTAWLDSVQFINTGTIASGAFSGQLTLPAKAASMLTVDSYSLAVDGRTSTGGGGSRVFVNTCVGNADYTANEFKIENTGQRLDGANTAFPIESIGILATLEGTWR